MRTQCVATEHQNCTGIEKDKDIIHTGRDQAVFDREILHVAFKKQIHIAS